MGKKKNGIIAVVIILLILIVDQVSKIWVKTNMSLQESIDIASWFQIYFWENDGMAFGMKLGGEENQRAGKLFLTLFRTVAIGFIAYYLHRIVKKEYTQGFIICIALIWAGAFGNLIDCIFYGEIFSASYVGHVASFVPFGEGYSSLLFGEVVDMLYFPIIQTTLPTWLPFWGGENFTFFSAIFNIADSAITVGIFILLIFYRKELSISLEGDKKIKEKKL